MALLAKPNLKPCHQKHHLPHSFSSLHVTSRARQCLTKLQFPSLMSSSRSMPPLLTTSCASEAAATSSRMILWSDVEVKNKRKRSTKWSTLDLATAGVVLSMHVLGLLAPFNFTWGALWTAVGLYIVTGLLGITLSFHRNLAHRSFKLPKLLEYLFAYCGVQALQGNPMDWVSTHRHHHRYCDSKRDPHSPTEGF